MTDVKVTSEDDVDRMLRACGVAHGDELPRTLRSWPACGPSRMRRVGSLRASASDDIDLDTLSVVIRTRKNGKPRRAPVDQPLGAAHRPLAGRAGAGMALDGGDALWVGKNGPLTSDGVRQVMRAATPRGWGSPSAPTRSAVAGPLTRLGTRGMARRR